MLDGEKLLRGHKKEVFTYLKMNAGKRIDVYEVAEALNLSPEECLRVLIKLCDYPNVWVDKVLFSKKWVFYYEV